MPRSKDAQCCSCSVPRSKNMMTFLMRYANPWNESVEYQMKNSRETINRHSAQVVLLANTEHESASWALDQLNCREKQRTCIIAAVSYQSSVRELGPQFESIESVIDPFSAVCCYTDFLWLFFTSFISCTKSVANSVEIVLVVVLTDIRGHQKYPGEMAFAVCYG